MGLEVFNFIDSLNSAWPTGAADDVGEGDEHLRGLKATLQNTFGNANRKYWLGGWAERSDKIRGITGTYTVKYADGLDTDNGRLLISNTASGAVTVNLPTLANAGEGFLVSVTKGDASPNPVSVVPSGAELINGINSPYSWYGQGETCYFWCTGTEWRLLAPTYPRSYSTTIAGGTKSITSRDHGQTFVITNPACVVTLPAISTVGDGFFVRLLNASNGGYFQVGLSASDVFSNGVTLYRNYGNITGGGSNVSQRVWVEGGVWRKDPTIYVATIVPFAVPGAVVENHHLGAAPFRYGWHVKVLNTGNGFNAGELAIPLNANVGAINASSTGLFLRLRQQIELMNHVDAVLFDINPTDHRIIIWGEL